ncbi:MAG: ribosome recycling factor [Candidatus Margulisbacteria bacterium]|jgi:ribosome recycling factor|nr:ribosome recycling factor [Candidatus Margulisiibacteriota bacterium]
MQEQEIRTRMDKAIDNLKRNFAGVRTGRANPGLVENVPVEVYGQKMALRTIAAINIPENKIISITPYDRSSAQAIEKAISLSDLGLTPKNEGGVVYVRLPELTQERRKELEKIAKGMAEEGKIAIRNLRRDFLEEAKKSGASQDEIKGLQDKVQKVTDQYNAKVEELLKTKEAEINEI